MCSDIKQEAPGTTTAEGGGSPSIKQEPVESLNADSASRLAPPPLVEGQEAQQSKAEAGGGGGCVSRQLFGGGGGTSEGETKPAVLTRLSSQALQCGRENEEVQYKLQNMCRVFLYPGSVNLPVASVPVCPNMHPIAMYAQLVQWTHSNTATLGTSQSVLIRGVASFQGWICTFWSGLNTGMASFQGSRLDGVHCICTTAC